jgi:hypothetical protein
VAKKDDKAEIAELERLNAQLSETLDRCRRILGDCRSRLAANGNERDAIDPERKHEGSA